MADGDNQSTAPNDVDQGTGGSGGESQPPEQPAATPNDQSASGAATGDEMVTISKKDLKEIQSQRDRNYEESRQATQYVQNFAKEKHISDFLADQKETFPDVLAEDLMGIEDPDDLEKAATAQQKRIDDAASRKLQQTQVAGRPEMSPDDKKAVLDKAKKDGDFGAFLSTKGLN